MAAPITSKRSVINKRLICDFLGFCDSDTEEFDTKASCAGVSIVDTGGTGFELGGNEFPIVYCFFLFSRLLFNFS